MSEPNAERLSALAAFRRDYFQRLPARVLAIEADWNVVCTADGGDERLEFLFRELHNLHGSAATCGFRAISNGAGALEEIVSGVRQCRMAPTVEQQSEFASRLDELKLALRDAAEPGLV